MLGVKAIHVKSSLQFTCTGDMLQIHIYTQIPVVQHYQNKDTLNSKIQSNPSKLKKKSKLKKQTLEKIHADLQLLFCKRKKSQPNLKLATKKKNSSDLVPTQ